LIKKIDKEEENNLIQNVINIQLLVTVTIQLKVYNYL